MNDIKNSELIEINNWTFRVKMPSKRTDPSKALLLLHGHLGNENAMWILSNPIPNDYCMISPRAPIMMGENQFSWHEITQQWPDLDHYHQLVDQLLSRVELWGENNHIKVQKLDVMGFSQGAVMAYAIAILYPDKIGKIAALAGFIPQSWKNKIPVNVFEGKEFFIAHGTRDEIVPIGKARKASDWIKENGAEVRFCEADTSHKISANCFNGLGEFFQTS